MRHLIPLLLAAACLPASAESLRLAGRFQDADAHGTASLDLAARTLELNVNEQRFSLTGYPLEHDAYLFVETPSAGLTDALGDVVPTAAKRAVVLVEALNVRPEPTLDCTPVRRATRGEALALNGVEQGPWLQLQDGGWVHGGSQYVRVEALYDADQIPGDGLRLTLRPNSRGYFGTVQSSADVLRLVRVTPSGPPRVLLIPTVRYTEKEQRTLKGYAIKLKNYYAQRGIRSDLHVAESADTVIRALEDAALSGRRYSRVIWIGHGGWDGPIMGTTSPRQVSATDNPEGFARMVAALDEVLTPDAKLFASACHAAGNNTFEAEMPLKSHYSWVHDLAKRTGRLVAGPAGYTSTEYTYQHVLAILEGDGVTKQEVHVATGDTLRIVWPGRTLASAPARPLPEIRTTRNPPETPVGTLALGGATQTP